LPSRVKRLPMAVSSEESTKMAAAEYPIGD
jgi:hypothetical protein